MADPEQNTPNRGSDATLGDDTSLSFHGKEPSMMEPKDPEKEGATGPDAQPNIISHRGLEASHLQDLEAQAPSPAKAPAQSTAQDLSADTVPDAVIVPASERRGWLGRFTIIPEVTEPKNYPRRQKWLITSVIAMAGIAAPFGSSIIFREYLARSITYRYSLI